MSESAGPQAAAGERVLLVADRMEDDARRVLEHCRQSGRPVDHVADVYLAMAALAGADHHEYGYAVVDTAALSADETRFLQLAPRYFPNIEVIDCAQFLRSTNPTERVGVPTAAAASDDDLDLDGLSLHEAVRRRMRAGAAPGAPYRPIQRIPPPNAAAPNESPDAQALASDMRSVLTREEIDALLNPRRGSGAAS
jgi:hypothetical protein